MCECHLTHNFFVRSVGMHCTYVGDDAEFRRQYAGCLPRGGPSIEEVLADVQAQHAKRLRAPVEAEGRAKRIAQEYVRLHPEAFTLTESFIDPSLNEIALAFKGCGSRPSHVAECIASLKTHGYLTEIRDGLWTFPALTERFCDLLESELQHFRASGLPHTAPNTMNRFGFILRELGFCSGLLDPFVYEYLDVIASKLLPLYTEGLDSYRAFTVLYDYAQDGDRELALHYDNAEVTFNVNIGGDWEGGQVTFHGLDGDRPGTDVVLRRGHGVLHAGLELHQARPITSGRRHNLIMWCRSSGVRNERCPMCFEQPKVVPTSEFSHEGFTVPPCHVVPNRVEAPGAVDVKPNL